MTVLFLSLSVLSLLYLILVFLTAPALRKHPDEAFLRGAKIAHRGLHDDSKPENSLPAFQNAMDHHYAIEIDIHLTRDGKVVVFHDSKINRMCAANGTIEEMTLKEIKSLRLLNTDCAIPTLEECLETVKGRVPLLIEFKTVDNTEELCRAADAILSRYHGKYLIQSFYPQVLRWYRKNRKEVCRGQLATRITKGPLHRQLLGKMFFNFLARPHFISYSHNYAKGLLWRFSCWLGATAVGWTFRSQEEWNQSEKYFSACIFENFFPATEQKTNIKSRKRKEAKK